MSIAPIPRTPAQILNEARGYFISVGYGMDLARDMMKLILRLQDELHAAEELIEWMKSQSAVNVRTATRVSASPSTGTSPPPAA